VTDIGQICWVLYARRSSQR